MRINTKTIQLTLISIGIFLILATYIFYPKLNQEKLKKSELENPEKAAIINKRLGEWASKKLGKNEEERKNYIQEVIKSDLEEAGQEDVFRKIKKDFQAASIDIEETEIRDQMEKALSRAEDKIFLDGREANAFENIEYNGSFNINNTFSVKSNKAHIFNDEPDSVYMTNMHVTLYLKNERIVNIVSNKGKYNKVTNDCFFEENVKATDEKTIIFAENLDLLATENFVKIYNNVKLNDPTGFLRADTIDYDFETKYFKVSMFDDKAVKMEITQ